MLNLNFQEIVNISSLSSTVAIIYNETKRHAVDFICMSSEKVGPQKFINADSNWQNNSLSLHA